MSRTGHRSEAAVQKYKCSNSVIQEKVSKALNQPTITKSENAPIPTMNQGPLKNSMKDPPKITEFKDASIPVINQEPWKNSMVGSNTQENLPISILNSCGFLISSRESVI
jgi:hypothetical protein